MMCPACKHSAAVCRYYIYNPISATVDKFTSFCVMDQLQKQALRRELISGNN